MKRVLFSNAADAALTDIYQFTEGRWGARQANKYVGELLRVADQIAAGDVVPRPIPPEFGVRGCVTRHGNHFVYWRDIDENTVGVVAILHASMMQGDRLRDAFGE
ncbi:MAG: type II toxin-antitoxin system RelE/ParE family toxin [Polyangiales bacterium]|nr:type II toxin-antitoxin system RelE/ParE family toxin [Sandaracinaceae bacterium]